MKTDNTNLENEQIKQGADLPAEGRLGRCPLCSQINHHEEQVRELASALLRLQKTIAPVLSRYKELEASHPRCAACGIMSGPDHEVKELFPEPIIPRAKGQKRYKVCHWCYADLHKSRMSVPQEKKYRKLLADLLAKEDDELYDDDNEENVLDSILDGLGEVDSPNDNNS